MDFAIYFLKIVHIFFDVCVWLFGGACLGIALWLYFDGDEFRNFRNGMDVEYVYVACAVLIVIGLFAMIMSLIGCIGVSNENRCLIITYTVVLIILLLLEFTVAGIIWANAPDMKDWIYDQVQRKVSTYYTGDKDNTRMVDFMQYYLGCCGATSFRDYDDSSLPNSCKNSVTGNASSFGCLELGEYFFERKAALFGGMALSLAFIQLFALIVNLILICGFKRRK